MAAESVIAIRCDSAGGDGCGVVVVLAGRFFAGARAASACRLARLDPVPVSGASERCVGPGTLCRRCWHLGILHMLDYLHYAGPATICSRIRRILAGEQVVCPPFLTGSAFVEICLGYLLIICLLQRPIALFVTLVILFHDLYVDGRGDVSMVHFMTSRACRLNLMCSMSH